MNAVTPVKEAYPGLVSFHDTDEWRALYRGREKEKAALLSQVLAENLVLLFSRSGLGKTSLINAGLLEPLRARRYFPVVVRVTHDPEGRPLTSVYECIRKEAERRGVEIHGIETRDTLWEYFLKARFVKQGRELRPMLVLDQFEELFTHIQSRGEAGAAQADLFLQQLADLIHRRMPDQLRPAALQRLDELEDTFNDERKELVSLLYECGGPEVKVLVAMREDYLAELEGVKTRIPEIFRASFRLEPLTKAQARQAILEPSQQTDVLGDYAFSFADGVVDEMIEYLARKKFEDKWVPSDQVDPATLQLLCEHLNHCRARKGPGTNAVITRDDLGGLRGMERIIRSRYAAIYRRFPVVRPGWSPARWRPAWTNFLLFHRPRLCVRRLCEEGLVAGDHRNSQPLNYVKNNFGVSERDAQALVELKLLRSEERLGTRFFELSHDTWIKPVIYRRRWRRLQKSALWIFTILLLPWLVVGTANHLDKSITRHRVEDTSRSYDERVKLLGDLVSSREGRDFRRLNFTNADLRNRELSERIFAGAYLPGASFVNCALYRANFARARLVRADFTQADASYGDFTAADLSEAQFGFAKIVGGKFERAILRGANFEGANFSSADLSGADLSGAEMKTTDFTGVTLSTNTLCREANWWLGYWSEEGRKQMAARWPVEKFADTSRNRTNLQVLNQAWTDANSDWDKAVALNNRAWYRATHGLDLVAALRDAYDALHLVSNNGDIYDTRGYIRLLQGDYAGAVSDLDNAVRNGDSTGAFRYHLALAYERSNNSAKAQEYYNASFKLNYRPSHELVLVPPPQRRILSTFKFEQNAQRQNLLKK